MLSAISTARNPFCVAPYVALQSSRAEHVAHSDARSPYPYAAPLHEIIEVADTNHHPGACKDPKTTHRIRCQHMEDLMSLRPFLDISAVHLNDEDVDLLETDATLMRCIKYDDGFIVSTSLLICEEERECRVARLRATGFSETFIALAVYAAKMGALLIRFESGNETDPMLPIDRPDIIDEVIDRSGTQLDLFEPRACIDPTAGRYLTCEWAEFAFIYEATPSKHRYWRVLGLNGCQNHLAIIRWVLDVATMEIVVLQVLDERSLLWEAASNVQRELVSAWLQQLRSSFAVHEELGVISQCSAVPAWAHQHSQDRQIA